MQLCDEPAPSRLDRWPEVHHLVGDVELVVDQLRPRGVGRGKGLINEFDGMVDYLVNYSIDNSQWVIVHTKTRSGHQTRVPISTTQETTYSV